MSHFSLMVIGEDVEDQLAPFCEQDEDYFQFIDLTQQARSRYWTDTMISYRLPNGELRTGYDPVLHKDNDVKKVWRNYSFVFSSFEEFAKWAEYSEEDGKFGLYGNPSPKWDWYQIGGRWAGFLIVKNEQSIQFRGEKSLMMKGDPYTSPKHCDSAYIKDIDFEAMQKQLRVGAESVWEEAQEKPPELREFIYGIHPDDTKEKFVERESIPTTFAVLKDGEWAEKGEMGWFAMVKNEKSCEDWEKLYWQALEDLPDDTRITIVDCHI